MFSQVVRGHTNAPAVVRRTLTRWAPTPGVTTITAGVTQDGRFIAVTTFESEEAARAANGDWRDVLDGQGAEQAAQVHRELVLQGVLVPAGLGEVGDLTLHDLHEARA